MRKVRETDVPANAFLFRGRLDVASNVAGNPSLATSEIVALSREWMARRARA